MKLRTMIISGLFLLGIAGITNAQTPQINNGGFENWDNISTENVEPTNWNSFMTADAGFPMSLGKAQRVNRSSVKRPGTTGTYSAVIWSTSTLGVIANGNLTTGKVNMGSVTPTDPANYNFTKTTDANFKHPFDGHPDSLVLWVRFKPASNGNEYARVHAVIHDNYNYRDPSGSDGNGPSHFVGDASLNFQKTNGLWLRKSIPFVYSGPSTTHVYILISLTTNMTGGQGSAGDSLYIDDMMVIYNPVLSMGVINPPSYLVSVADAAPISVPFTLTGTMYADNVVTAQLSDAAGSFASPVTLGTLSTMASGTINGTIPAGTPTGGGYRVRVVSSNYALTAADNGTDIVISDVTGIDIAIYEHSSVYFSENSLVADMQNSSIVHPQLQLFNMNGQLVAEFELQNKAVNQFELDIPAGLYMYRIASGEQMLSGKLLKK